MSAIDGLQLVHYCYPGCTPLKNIMRLPRTQAYALARDLAGQHRDTTAFYRFADFEHYYPERLKTDELLYQRFIELGGHPREAHPLSFVLQGSDYLADWFGHGTVIRVPLHDIPAEAVSFTCGDSMGFRKRHGELTMLTKAMLYEAIASFDGPLAAFLADMEAKYHYIEAQVWDDACLEIKEPS